MRLIVRLGNEAQFDGETVMISRFGAKLRLGPYHRKLVSGDNVRLCPRGSYNWRTARIAWIDRTTSSYCGIELQDPENFWGVNFPEKPTADAGEDFSLRPGYTPLAMRNRPSVQAAAQLPLATPSIVP